MYHIKIMTVDDLNDVHHIEQQVFVPHHWTKEMFEYEIVNNDYATYYLLCKDDLTIGFIGIWHLFGEVQIVNFAILPNYRGQHLGHMLLNYVLDQQALLGADSAFLEVRVSNYIAQNLYRQFDFEIIDKREKYYVDNGEDAYVMRKIFNKGEMK